MYLRHPVPGGDHAAPRSGRGQDPHDPPVPGLGGRRRVQRGPRSAPMLRSASGGGHRFRAQRGGLAVGGSDPPGRGGYLPDQVGAVRRHRPIGAQRAEFHRAGLWNPWCGRLLGPRPHCCISTVRGRHRLGAHLRHPRGPLVSHRRHLRGPFGNYRRRGDRGGTDRQAARNRGLLRPQLSTVPLEGLRRPRSLPRGEPGHRSLAGCDPRQRGGLHGVPGFRGGRRRTRTWSIWR